MSRGMIFIASPLYSNRCRLIDDFGMFVRLFAQIRSYQNLNHRIPTIRRPPEALVDLIFALTWSLEPDVMRLSFGAVKSPISSSSSGRQI